MNKKQFVSLVGTTLTHVTARENMPTIELLGLMCAKCLAIKAGADDIALRKERLLLATPAGQVRLNDQKRIANYADAAFNVLDGHTPKTWAEQLDTRIFFWPSKGNNAFKASVDKDLPTETLTLDAALFFEKFHANLWLSPINSGNFSQGGAKCRRGDWLYVGADKSVREFKYARADRKLVSSPDSVKEVSVTVPIGPKDLRDLAVGR